MSSDRSPDRALARAKIEGRRMLRWSWRYDTWQVRDPVAGIWRNVRPELARCYAAAGIRVTTR